MGDWLNADLNAERPQMELIAGQTSDEDWQPLNLSQPQESLT